MKTIVLLTLLLSSLSAFSQSLADVEGLLLQMNTGVEDLSRQYPENQEDLFALYQEGVGLRCSDPKAAEVERELVLQGYFQSKAFQNYKSFFESSVEGNKIKGWRKGVYWASLVGTLGIPKLLGADGGDAMASIQAVDVSGKIMVVAGSSVIFLGPLLAKVGTFGMLGVSTTTFTTFAGSTFLTWIPFNLSMAALTGGTLFDLFLTTGEYQSTDLDVERIFKKIHKGRLGKEFSFTTIDKESVTVEEIEKIRKLINKKVKEKLSRPIRAGIKKLRKKSREEANKSVLGYHYREGQSFVFNMRANFAEASYGMYKNSHLLSATTQMLEALRYNCQ